MKEPISVPEIILGNCGHGKISLIKTAANGAEIAAAATKMTSKRQIPIIIEDPPSTD